MKNVSSVMINRRSSVSSSIATAIHAAGAASLRSAQVKRIRVVVIGHTGRGDDGHTPRYGEEKAGVKCLEMVILTSFF